MNNRFEPSHFSKGNHMFKTTIEIDDTLRTVTCRRLKLIGSKAITYNAYDISMIKLNTRTEYLYLSEIILTIIGADIIVLNVFTIRNAWAIKEIIDQIKLYFYQITSDNYVLFNLGFSLLKYCDDTSIIP